MKSYALLLISYVVSGLISGKIVVVLLASTLSAYGFGLYLEHLKGKHRQCVKEVSDKQEKKVLKVRLKKQRQYVLAVGIFAHLSLFVILKYFVFLSDIFVTMFHQFQIPIVIEVPKLLVPIGLSFFTLQIIAYLVDVYRDAIQADCHWGRLALFIDFFPQIIEGPIVRYNQTAAQLWAAENIRYSNLVLGLQRILFGLFKKIVIADRLNPLIFVIFTNPHHYRGGVIAIGAVAYTIQLYMEFSGSLDAVIGIGQIFNIHMPENFRQPFMSRTISEFWQRWHITLGNFFKDYVFYPLSMSQSLKKLTGKVRKRLGNTYGPLMVSGIALFVVWLFNGLWHGAGTNFLFFGLYHFFFILMENLVSPLSHRISKTVNVQSWWYTTMQRTRTILIVIIGEMFFRANGFSKGFHMFSQLVTDFQIPNLNADLLARLGIDMYDIGVVIIAVLIVTIVGHFKEKDVAIREKIASLPIVWRWGFWYALILLVIIFGAYGGQYAPVDPIYANF